MLEGRSFGTFGALDVGWFLGMKAWGRNAFATMLGVRPSTHRRA